MSTSETAPKDVAPVQEYEARHSGGEYDAVDLSEGMSGAEVAAEDGGYQSRHAHVEGDPGEAESEYVSRHARPEETEDEPDAEVPVAEDEIEAEPQTSAEADTATMQGIAGIKTEAQGALGVTLHTAAQRVEQLTQDPATARLIRTIQEGGPQVNGAVRQLEVILDNAGRGLSEADAMDLRRYVGTVSDFVDSYSREHPAALTARETARTTLSAARTTVQEASEQGIPTIGGRLLELEAGAENVSPEVRDALTTTIGAVTSAAHQLASSADDLSAASSRVTGDNPFDRAPLPHYLQELTYDLQSTAAQIANGNGGRALAMMDRVYDLRRLLSQISTMGDELAQDNASMRTRAQDASDSLNTLLQQSPLFRG
jgi:hypothetical protein